MQHWKAVPIRRRTIARWPICLYEMNDSRGNRVPVNPAEFAGGPSTGSLSTRARLTNLGQFASLRFIVETIQDAEPTADKARHNFGGTLYPGQSPEEPTCHGSLRAQLTACPNVQASPEHQVPLPRQHFQHNAGQNLFRKTPMIYNILWLSTICHSYHSVTPSSLGTCP